jgi:hypothetical protein
MSTVLCVEYSCCVQDWDKSSTPLSASGKEPKFVKPPDKFSSTEGEHAFVILEITGDPIPKFEWFRVRNCYNENLTFRPDTRNCDYST